MKKLAVAVAAALLATIGVATPANATTTACPARTYVPDVAIDRPYKAVTATLVSSCNAVYASWDVYTWKGLEDIVIFDPEYPNWKILDIYDWATLGYHQLRTSHAHDADYNTVSQAGGSFYVRLASRALVSVYRSGSYVWVRGGATRYNPSVDGYRAWSGAKVTIQYRIPGETTWRYAAAGYTGTSGNTPYARVYAPKGRYFRAVTTSTSYIWGATSGSVFR